MRDSEVKNLIKKEFLMTSIISIRLFYDEVKCSPLKPTISSKFYPTTDNSSALKSTTDKSKKERG